MNNGKAVLFGLSKDFVLHSQACLSSIFKNYVAVIFKPDVWYVAYNDSCPVKEMITIFNPVAPVSPFDYVLNVHMSCDLKISVHKMRYFLTSPKLETLSLMKGRKGLSAVCLMLNRPHFQHIHHTFPLSRLLWKGFHIRAFSIFQPKQGKAPTINKVFKTTENNKKTGIKTDIRTLSKISED